MLHLEHNHLRNKVKLPVNLLLHASLGQGVRDGVNTQDSVQEGAVLSKALMRAAQLWDISNKQLSEICGLSEATISRLKNGQYTLDKNQKAWQIAILFLRIFRGLDAYMGGNIDNQKAWLNAHNSALGGAPIELMCDIEGLASVVQYLDYVRGSYS
jgi:Protein of unknown function (DUF2384)